LLGNGAAFNLKKELNGFNDYRRFHVFAVGSPFQQIQVKLND
jgi:hypothetical protein